MTSSSYADSIYVKSRYADRVLDASGCVDSSTDFSFAMLDMENSGFETDYATRRPVDDLMACYLGPGDSDARIYNAEFLERLAHDFPQYKHVVAATNAYDAKCVKDAYNAITNSQKQDRAARRTGSDRNNVGSRTAKARLVSVFCGSYDEQHMLRVVLKGNNTSHEATPVPEASLESSSSHFTNSLCHGDSDSEYDDRRSIKRFKHGSRNSSKPAFSAHTARNDSEHVPPLCLDDASSPESYSIETPNLSPMTTPLTIEETEAEIPYIPDLNSSPGTPKDPISTPPGYNIVSNELVVASWGSDMGKFCHPMPGGYECSCGHRAGTMGDMTRHWQSKRHSDAAFSCKACGKVYTREDALKRHMRRNDECARKARRIGSLTL